MSLQAQAPSTVTVVTATPVHRRRGRTRVEIFGDVVGTVCLFALLAFAVFPILWMVISSFRPATELFTSPPLPTFLRFHVGVVCGGSRWKQCRALVR